MEHMQYHSLKICFIKVEVSMFNEKDIQKIRQELRGDYDTAIQTGTFITYVEWLEREVFKQREIIEKSNNFLIQSYKKINILQIKNDSK